MASATKNLEALAGEIAACRACERLVVWREAAPKHPRSLGDPARYWARPVPGFGDARAELLIVGLAPAAHGANRTGRMFTGDRSGDFLFGALHRAGLANQAESSSNADGLELSRTFVTAAVRCAPPDNRPTNDERDRCRHFLARELEILRGVKVVLALGAFAFEALFRDGLLELAGDARRPKFAHGLELLATSPVGALTLVASYHPSQRNVFTGLLTPSMFDEVIQQAIAHLDEGGLKPG
jgi:uracil-DNA glycosylase family 4